MKTRLKIYKMATSILLKFVTLKWNISRIIGRIEVGDGSFFCIFHALSFELNFFLDRRFPLNSYEDFLKSKQDKEIPRFEFKSGVTVYDRGHWFRSESLLTKYPHARKRWKRLGTSLLRIQHLIHIFFKKLNDTLTSSWFL